MIDGSNGHPTITSGPARTVDEIVGVLPGPPPVVWGSQPRSVLVIGAHPGDALVGFGVGLHALATAGWQASLVSVFDDIAPADPRRWTALETIHDQLGRAVNSVQHLSRDDRSEVDDLAGLIADLADGYDVVIGPADAAGTHDDHGLVARALTAARPAGAVYRYLLPSQRIDADPSATRRASVPADDVMMLQDARLELMDRLSCVDGRDSEWPRRTGMTTASDPILVPALTRA